jgi:hypothetical protein
MLDRSPNEEKNSQISRSSEDDRDDVPQDLESCGDSSM